MNLIPKDIDELSRCLAKAGEKQDKIESIDLRALNRLLEHTPEDMTATVEAGMALAQLQAHLRKRGQWLPVDPPGAEQLTIAGLLENNASGPRRFGYGTIRDYVIGIAVVLADGRLIHSGGKVVKNVAGYDHAKLFIGSRGSLGVIVQVTFKVLPVPEAEEFVKITCASFDEANHRIESLLNSALSPVVFDLHNQSVSRNSVVIVLGFAGTREDVEWQLDAARAIGFNKRSSLEYEADFFNQPVLKMSVLPSKTVDALRGFPGCEFMARAGNGIIWHKGGLHRNEGAATKLERRLKQAFDPNDILAPLQASVNVA